MKENKNKFFRSVNFFYDGEITCELAVFNKWQVIGKEKKKEAGFLVYQYGIDAWIMSYFVLTPS